MSLSATLYNVPLMQGGGNSFPLVAGANFASAVFEFPQDKSAVFKGAGRQPLDLVINDGIESKTFQNLYLLGILPGASAQTCRVRVVDRRFFWTRKLVERTYNKRRDVGVKRVGDPSRAELQPLSKDVWYCEWSLKNGQPWTAKQILQDVLEEVCKAEALHAGRSPQISLLIPDNINQLPVEDLQLADTGENAVARVLAYIPDAMLYLTPAGDVVVRAKSDVNREAEILNQMQNLEVWQRGHVEYVSFPLQIPSEVHVHFEYAAEVKFSFLENSGTAPAWGDDDRFLENVMPNPFFTLTVAGQPVPRGAYLTFDQVLAAIPDIPRVGGRRINYADLRICCAPFMDMNPLIFGSNMSFDSTTDWSGAAEAFPAHYRLTMRMNRRWVDRVKSMEARRIGIVDSETGDRAASEVFQDYGLIPTQKARVIYAESGTPIPACVNVRGYASTLDSTARPSPFEVNFISDSQGIFSLKPIQDKLKRFEAPLRSRLNTPISGNLNDLGVPRDLLGEGVRATSVAFNMTVTKGQYPALAADHQMSVVLTLVPAGTNDTRSLYRVVVKPDDVRGFFSGQDAQAALSAAKGPIQELKIGHHVAAAQVRWLDSRSGDIERIFIPGSSAPNTDGLVINAGLMSDPANGIASLQAIAKARAAAVYARYMPRFVGTATGRFAPDAVPGGYAEEVRHTINDDGTVSTAVTFPEQIIERDWTAYLDANTRAMLFKTPRR